MMLFFQRSPSFTTLEAGYATDTEDFVDLIAEKMDFFSCDLQLFAVAPQPKTDCPVLLVAPCQCHSMALTTICFQLFRCEDDHRFWMDYVDGTVTVCEVSDALASDWIPGSAVYVGEQRRPLDEDQRIAVQPGCLITIVAPGSAFPVMRLLDAMLPSPEGRFRDLDRLGFPPDVFLPYQYCLLQPLHGPVFVPFLYMGPPADFDAVMCSHASAGWGSVALHRPRLEVLDLQVRQRSVGALFAAFPSQLRTRAAVFIDARDICRPVQVYASFTGTMHITEFLRSVGLEVPDPLDLIVTGTARYQQFSGAITVAEDDQIGLSFGARRMMAQPFDICPDGVGAGGGDGPRPEGDEGGPPDRERSPTPRRVYPAGPMRPSALVGPRAAVVTAGLSATSLGFDVARQGLLADPTFAAVRFHSLQELRARLRRCALPRENWVGFSLRTTKILASPMLTSPLQLNLLLVPAVRPRMQLIHFRSYWASELLCFISSVSARGLSCGTSVARRLTAF